MKVTLTTVRNALTFRTFGGNAEQIREMALSKYGGKVCFEHNHTDGTQYPYYSPSEHENLFEFELD